MKVYSSASFLNLFQFSAHNPYLNKKIRVFLTYLVLFITIGAFISFYSSTLKLVIVFSLCVLSMQHLKTMPWIGFDLNLMATIWITYTSGFTAGAFISCASVVGLITVGEADNLIFDTFAGCLLVPLTMILMSVGLPMFTIMQIGLIWYVLIGFIYHYNVGTLEFANTSWLSSYLVINLIIIYFLSKYF